jgi:hypothetical protein
LEEHSLICVWQRVPENPGKQLQRYPVGEAAVEVQVAEHETKERSKKNKPTQRKHEERSEGSFHEPAF